MDTSINKATSEHKPSWQEEGKYDWLFKRRKRPGSTAFGTCPGCPKNCSSSMPACGQGMQDTSTNS